SGQRKPEGGRGHGGSSSALDSSRRSGALREGCGPQPYSSVHVGAARCFVDSPGTTGAGQSRTVPALVPETSRLMNESGENATVVMPGSDPARVSASRCGCDCRSQTF